MSLLVYITLPLEQDPEKFCTELLEAKLAAGMNILGPCRSLFHWQNELKKKEEWVILAQVAEESFVSFKKAALDIHPYEIPCIIGFHIDSAYPPFLSWIKACCEARQCS